MRRLLPLASVTLIALSAVACGSGDPEKGPSTEAPQAVQPAKGQAVATYQVTVEKGKVVRFQPVKTSTIRVNGFDLDGASLFTFDTPKVCNGANPGDTGSDCSFTSPTCGSSQVCADVTVQYNAASTSNIVANTWIELRDYAIDGVADTGNNVRLATSSNDAVPTQLTGKLTSARDHRNYGQLTSGAAATSKRWDFDMGGGIDPSTQTFTFLVDVYTSFTHTSYSVTEALSQSFPDACAGGTTVGAYMDGVTGENYASGTNFVLPFPVVIYETSQMWGRASENGAFCLDDNTATVLCSTSGSNQATPTTRFPPGSGVVAAFWDDLDIDVNTTAKICTRTTGSAPSRQFLVTWLDMAAANGTGTETISFTVVLSEGSDDIEVVYKNPGTISAVTRGSISTSALQHRITSSSYWHSTIWHNTTNLSATSTDYAISKKYVAQ